MVLGETQSVSRFIFANLGGLLRLLRWPFVILFVLTNLLIYRHASLFFTYTEGGERTKSPESLSWTEKLDVILNGVRIPKPKAHADPLEWGMAFETIQVPGRDGEELAAWRIPASDPDIVVLMFHGYSAEKSGLLPEAAQFHELGCEVVMVDFMGSGGSPGYLTSVGIYEADDVAGVFRWARSHYLSKRIVLYGHSMGGTAIMRALALNDIRPDAAIIESVFTSLRDAIHRRFDLMSMPSFPAADIFLFWGSIRLGANGFRHDVVQYAASVDTPVLVIHGDKDNRAPWQGGRRVAEALGSRGEFLLIPGAGHVNPCQTDPGRWRGETARVISP